MSSKDSDFYAICRKQIEKKLNWTEPENLKQSDFEYLCDLVFECTKTQLSLSTIKRFWNSSYQKSFQLNTLNALAQFLDYKNWFEFKELNLNETNQVASSQDSGVRIHKKMVKKGRSLKFILISVVVLGTIITALSITNKKNSIELIKDIDNEVVFNSKKSVKEGVPSTIIFNYDVSSYSADSICIQLSWNKKERENIDKNNHFYTCTYYYPGYHHAKLVVDNKIVKEHNIHITTKDWLTLVRYEPDDVMPVYIRNDKVISNGTMYASPYLLKSNNVDLTVNSFYVSYFNIKELSGLSADSFSFETVIKNDKLEPEIICQNCRIFIYAENGAIVLPISSKGCVSDIGILASDVHIEGKTNDLSAFGCEISDWRKISGTVINNNIKLFIDDKEIYNIKYNKSLGKFKGWHYFFKGSGAVRYLKILDSEKNIVYQDDFIR